MAEEWPGISNSATEEKVKESVPLQIPNEQLSSTVSLEEERQNKRLKCSSHDKKQYVNQDQYSIQQEDCRPLHDSTNHTVTLSPNKKPAPSEKEDHSASTDLSDDDNVWLEFDDIGLPSLLNQIDNSVSTTASSLPTTEMLLQQTEKTLYSFGGFKSAGSKKNVAPSKQAFLTASRAVYRLLSEPKDSFPADLSQATATTVSSTPPLTDDSTATSPLVKRSPNSIALAPAPSDTCVSIPGQSRPATTLQCAPDTSSCQYEEYIQNFGGFRTAGSKRRSIHVSDEARLHAASIFAPITTPTILTQAPQCSSRPSLNDASTSHLEPNHSFLFSAQELLSISRRPVENQKVNEMLRRRQLRSSFLKNWTRSQTKTRHLT
ncbi:hypothetical protein DM01DRAFT_1118999 [Hesseltinella vesiculosa]|uniref:Uncharacterized protein n=1 Tax=Hesseltinella vesiculosa TaxID=101127 RepID=A0A1X2GTH9_9FUNG|nr:hypothetical protein DM01DRAFT_1118999 [Hesseltinella vesiculosa]